MDPVFILLFVLGCSIGSFLNVLIDRLPHGEDVVRGRSHCDHCGRTLQWYELIPLVSWLLQGGRSRCCKKRISLQYPLVEAATGFGFVGVYTVGFHGQLTPIVSFLASLVLLSSFFGIFVCDLKTELIPVEFLWGGFAASIFLHSPLLFSCVAHQGASCSLLFSFILPALIGGLFFFLLWFFSKGKAMGDGDIYLAALIGLALGYPRTIIAYYAAFLTGAVVGVILILARKKRMRSHISFGPFLILGYGIACLVGPQVMQWWSQLW